MKKDKDLKTLEDLGFNFYKKEENNSNKFIMIPKQFYLCDFYKKYLTPTTRELYAWLVDRMSLSERTTKKGDNSYVDENGYIYLIFSRENIMKTLGISKQTTADAFKILNKLGLIYEKKLGQGKANRIYIGKVRYLEKEEAIKLIELVEKNGLFQKSKNSTSKNLKTRPLKVEKLDAINTESNETESSETDTSSSSDTLFVNNLNKKFEENICVLRKTTKLKFNSYAEKYNADFLDTIIEYCAETNIKSFAGFKTVIDSYIKKNILTAEGFKIDVESFRKNKNKAYNKTKNSKTYNNKKEDGWGYEGQRDPSYYTNLVEKLLKK